MSCVPTLKTGTYCRERNPNSAKPIKDQRQVGLPIHTATMQAAYLGGTKKAEPTPFPAPQIWPGGRGLRSMIMREKGAAESAGSIPARATSGVGTFTAITSCENKLPGLEGSAADGCGDSLAVPKGEGLYGALA